MKKIWSLLLIGIISLSLVSCSFISGDLFKENEIVNPNDIEKPNTNIKNEITEIVVDYDNLSVEDLQNAVLIASKKVENAVIGISLKEVTYKNALIPDEGTVEANVSVGSGVIFKREEIRNEENVLINYKYYVITNRHVVTDEAKADTVKYNVYAYLGYEDTEILADLIGYDNKVDIALISFEHSTYIDPVDIGKSSELEKGSFAIAVGNPDGYDYYGSVTFGVVSGPLRYIDTDTDDDDVNDFSAAYIQHDVAINPGNSGGGLFDIYGRLIGINTLKLVGSDIDNMGFAIPIDTVMIIIEDYLMNGLEIVRPRLGVLGIEIRSLSTYQIENSEDILSLPDIYGSQKPYGIYVNEIYENTSLSETNIEKHDIILKIGDTVLTRMNILTAKLNSLVDYQVGDTVPVTYYDRSDNSIYVVNVVLRGN